MPPLRYSYPVNEDQPTRHPAGQQLLHQRDYIFYISTSANDLISEAEEWTTTTVNTTELLHRHRPCLTNDAERKEKTKKREVSKGITREGWKEEQPQSVGGAAREDPSGQGTPELDAAVAQLVADQAPQRHQLHMEEILPGMAHQPAESQDQGSPNRVARRDAPPRNLQANKQRSPTSPTPGQLEGEADDPPSPIISSRSSTTRPTEHNPGPASSTADSSIPCGQPEPQPDTTDDDIRAILAETATPRGHNIQQYVTFILPGDVRNRLSNRRWNGCIAFHPPPGPQPDGGCGPGGPNHKVGQTSSSVQY